MLLENVMSDANLTVNPVFVPPGGASSSVVQLHVT